MGYDYTIVTEVAGVKASREQLEMLYTRYRYAAEFCEGKDVLEVACGGGHGLGYLAKRARRVVGGDYTERLLQVARRHYRDTLPLVRLDAHALPFQAQSFDVVILYEAIYYLANPDQFLEECHRVLRHDGVLLICTVNKVWSDFNPSPFSSRYFSAWELLELLQRHKFQADIFGAFPVAKESVKNVVVSFIKRIAVTLHLVPRTMKGKEFLKRIFFGKLASLPSEICDGMADYAPLYPIFSNSEISTYKVLYTVGRIG